MAYGELQASAVAAGGTCTLTIKSGRQRWMVQQVSTSLPSAPAGATCTLKKNGAYVTDLVATGDVAGGDPSVQLGPADTMTVVWTGVTNGSTGSALVIYDDGTSDR